MKMFKRKQPLTPFQDAVKEGILTDMQVKPYAEFNRFLQVSCPLWMTRAAYKEFILIPHEKGYKRVQKDLRWAMVLSAFRRIPPEGDPMELVYDVNILCLSGFHHFKPIKLISVGTEHDSGLLWLLPNEELPLAVEDSDTPGE